MISLKIAKLLLSMQNAFLGSIVAILFKNRIDSRDPERILLLRTSALGDFLFAVPGMAALRKRFPHSKIMLLTATTTNRDQSRIVQGYTNSTASFPWLSFMVPAYVDEVTSFFSLNISYLLNEIKPRVESFNPDMTFILSHPGDPGLRLLKKILFLRFVGVKHILYGYRMRSSISFFREAQHKAGLYEHKVFGPLRAIAECTLLPRIEDINIEFPLHIEDKTTSWIDQFWQEKRLSTAPIIAIAPGSIQPHKRWPVEKFISLCQRLESSYKIIFTIIGTNNDYSIGESIRAHLKSEVINCAGVLSINQAGALLKRCCLLVGNDGGAVHLAAVMGCPTVSIIPGLEYPGSVEPWGYAEFAVRNVVSCSPCYSFTKCPKIHNGCMIDLPVDRVFAQCIRILDRKDSNLCKSEY